MKVSARPIDQRDTYVPGWPPERFIVPLLAKKIPEVFKQCCAPTRKDARALDAGCGMQPFRAMLEEAGYHYSSMDAAQNRAGTVDLVSLLDEPLPAAALEQPPYDFILCTEVMEHVAGWKAAFGNFAALLAPGGRMLMTCPHFYPLHETPYDYWRPTPFAIERFANESGLKVVCLEQLGGPWEVLGTLLAESHCYPANSRLQDRIAAKLGQVVRNAVDRALRSAWWRGRVELRGPYFLSLIAVLEKPTGDAQ